MNLHARSDQELLSEVTRCVGSQRLVAVRLIECLAEIEERRLHLKAGFSSMFEFCVKELGMGEGEAFRRILAARLGRRFPLVTSMLASGAVHLSTLERLREHLTESNHRELLAAAAGKGKREVEAMLAARFPRPDVPSRVTRARIEPLSEARYKVEFTASVDLRDKLELCRDLMSHVNPSRDLGTVIGRAVNLLVVELEKKRTGRTERARPERSGREVRPRGITRAVRRRVFERDGLCCSYVSPGGRRCEARAFLELDHAVPRAVGGPDAPENLRVRCRAHNQLWAEEVFGREKVDRGRHFCQKKWLGLPGDSSPRAEARTTEGPQLGAFEKVRLALRTMGFRDAQVRDAVTKVQQRHDEPLTVEQALREALLVVTEVSS